MNSQTGSSPPTTRGLWHGLAAVTAVLVVLALGALFGGVAGATGHGSSHGQGVAQGAPGNSDHGKSHAAGSQGKAKGHSKNKPSHGSNKGGNSSHGNSGGNAAPHGHGSDHADHGQSDSHGNSDSTEGNAGNSGGDPTDHGDSSGGDSGGGQSPGHGNNGGDKGGHNPPGNNGTIKIDAVEFDDHPNNEPHVGCTFQVDFYGFDRGDYDATVTFADHSPTADGGLSVTSGQGNPSSVFIGEDDASGGGSEAGLDASETYTLSFSGEPHPKQGYHVKLTINAPGSKGADVKHKVFWVQGCEDEETPPTSSPPTSSPPSSSPPTSSPPTSGPPTSSSPPTSSPPATTPPASPPETSTPPNTPPSNGAPPPSTQPPTQVDSGLAGVTQAALNHPIASVALMLGVFGAGVGAWYLARRRRAAATEN